MKSLSSILFIAWAFLVNPILLAEDIPTPAISASTGPTVEQSLIRKAGDEEDVPLDAWIIHKKEVLKESPSDVPSGSPSLDFSSIDQESEEKRIYKALIEDYHKDTEEVIKQKEIREKRKPQEIFKKTALSKRDQARIDKIKNIQKKIVAEQKIEFADLLEIKKDHNSTLRLCMLNYPVLGLPSELRKIDPNIKSSELTNDWKNGLKLIVQTDCSIVLYTGVYGKTSSKIKEFLDKTLNYLHSGTGSTWKMLLNSDEANSTFAVLYNTQLIEIVKFERLIGLELRRGGPFQENKFSLIPLELTLEKKNEPMPKRYTIISFDLRDKSSPLKKPNIHFQMQMASALLEASINRVNQNNDESVILAGFLGENRGHPAFQVLQGIVTPVDFLEGKACTLTEKEKPLFHCDKTQLDKAPRIMMGVFSDLQMFFNKQQKNSLKRDVGKRTSEFFINESSLDNLKSSPKNKLLGASFDVIKGKQFEYTFLYVDLLGGNKE